MAELEFERRLERLFGEAPAFADSEAFATGVERRLDRGWRTRRVLIGVAGVSGGVVGASQLIVSNFAGAVENATAAPARLWTGAMEEFAQAEWVAGLAGAGQGIWLAAGLAGLAVAFVITRMIEEI
jgi:hypothetical protein